MTSTREKPSWVLYLEGDCLGKQSSEGFVVYEVVVKVRDQGLMGIVKARDGDSGVVAFVGGRTLQSLSGEVRRLIAEDSPKWRPDKYFRI